MEDNKSIVDFIINNQEKFYRIAYTYVKNNDDALDIVHNAIVKALQRQHTLRNKEYLKTWFYRIVINESISFLRRYKRTVSMGDLTESEDVAADDAFHRHEYEDLYHAVQKLPVKLKTVVLLRYFEDMSLSEIAEITSTKLSTTKSRLYKALEILKVDLEVTRYD